MTDRSPQTLDDQQPAADTLMSIIRGLGHLPTADMHLPATQPRLLEIRPHTLQAWEAWREALTIPTETAQYWAVTGGGFMDAVRVLGPVTVRVTVSVPQPVDTWAGVAA